MKTIGEKAAEFATREAKNIIEYAFLYKAYYVGATEALASQWRSVEDELPEDDNTVLVRLESEEFEKPTYSTGFCVDGHFNLPDIFYCDCKVTHWMPIPELKTEEQ